MGRQTEVKQEVILGELKLPLPENEDSRLESLRSFCILGTSCEQEFDDIAHLAATTVSYTHLDVYKRQVLARTTV